MDAYTVYCHVNKLNGKRYVGLTCQAVEKRWDNGWGYYSNKHFFRAIKQVGWNDGFEHVILFDGLTKQQAQDKEQEYILKYETHNPKKGYNGTFGGEAEVLTKEAREKQSRAWANKSPEELKAHGMRLSKALKGRTLSLETRQRMSASRIGSKNCLYGKNFSDEHRRRLSESHRGKTQTDETRQKRSVALKGNVHNSKRIVCINTGEVFNSIQSAEEQYGILSQNIGKCCLGKLRSAGRHPKTGERLRWAYAEKHCIGGENIC